MYGTIARMRVKPGMAERMMALMEEYEDLGVPGYRGTYVYRMDGDSNEHYLVVLFDSKADYVANAQSPEQNERYLEYVELLDGEPEWHDGEVVYALTP